MNKLILTAAAALMICAVACGQNAQKNNASTTEIPEQVNDMPEQANDTLEITQTCLVTFYEIPMEEEFSFYLYDTKEIFRKMGIDIIYTESRYLSYMLNNGEKKTLDLKKHLKETYESVLLYKKGHDPLYVGLGGDINIDKVSNFLGDEATQSPDLIPSELLIVPGVRIGDEYLVKPNGKWHAEWTCTSAYDLSDVYRTAEGLGEGSTLQDVLEVYPTYILKIPNDATPYKSLEKLSNLTISSNWGVSDKPSLFCFSNDGVDLGIVFRLTRETTNSSKNLTQEWKVWRVEIYLTPFRPGMTPFYHLPADGNKKPLGIASVKKSEFLRPAKESEEEYFGTFPYTHSSNGQFYHFDATVSEVLRGWGGLFVDEVKYTATSSLAPSGNISYDAQNLDYVDVYDDAGGGRLGNRKTAWCEGVEGYGIGESVTMSIITQTGEIEKDRAYKYGPLMIVNGYAKDAVTWKDNSRVKTLRLYVGNTYWCDLHIADIIEPQIFRFPSYMAIYPAKHGKEIPAKGKFEDHIEGMPIYQTDLRFEIIEVYPGDKYDDTCITGISISLYGGIGE